MENHEFPSVDIIIPTYKRPVLLKRALESVLNQTYPNIAHIIVTDDSNDGAETKQLIKGFQARDTRITYVYNDRYSHCPAGNKNNGMDYISSDFFAILDDDDWLEQNAIEELVDTALKGNYDFVFANCIDDNGNFTGEHHGKTEDATYRDFICGYFDGEYFWLFKTSSVANHRFDDKLIYGEHVMIWNLLKGKKACYLHKALRHYNTRGFRLTTAVQKNPEKFFDIWYETCTVYEEDFLRWCPKKLQKYLTLLAYHASLAGKKEKAQELISQVYRKTKNPIFLVPIITLNIPHKLLVQLRLIYTNVHLGLRNVKLRVSGTNNRTNP